MSTDLHAQLLAEVQRRLDIARAAASGPWSIHTAGTGIRSSTPYAWVLRPDGAAIAERHNGGTLADVEHIAQHDPVDAIRRYEADLRRLDRHAPSTGHPLWPDKVWCCGCPAGHDDWGIPPTPYPCREIRDLAASLGVEVTE